jgi:hypothetical protein
MLCLLNDTPSLHFRKNFRSKLCVTADECNLPSGGCGGRVFNTPARFQGLLSHSEARALGPDPAWDWCINWRGNLRCDRRRRSTSWPRCDIPVFFLPTVKQRRTWSQLLSANCLLSSMRAPSFLTAVDSHVCTPYFQKFSQVLTIQPFQASGGCAFLQHDTRRPLKPSFIMAPGNSVLCGYTRYCCLNEAAGSSDEWKPDFGLGPSRV